MEIEGPSEVTKEGVSTGSGGFKDNCNSCGQREKSTNTVTLNEKVKLKVLKIGRQRILNIQTLLLRESQTQILNF